jgi:ABC-type cobalamin/Fe3+-siderophores transport system ATPase subunit
VRVRLEARDIVYSAGGKAILDGASIKIEIGQIVALQGASGSGKTTLLRILGGLTEPDAGALFLDGKSAHEIRPAQYRRRVAFVLQNPPMLAGARMSDAAIDQFLTRVGLEGFRLREARVLSGGEKQRVALARALANEPEVLLLDEPTSALDPAATERVLSVIRSLAANQLAIALVTHDNGHAVAVATKRFALEAGRVHEAA